MFVVGFLLLAVAGDSLRRFGYHAEALLTYRAKFVGNFRVNGDGYLTMASSLHQCLALCNKDKSCDGVNYFARMYKCRLLSRCSAVKIVQASSNYKYYAKRPPVSADDYIYEEESDTCLKATDRKTSYNGAMQVCAEDHSRLLIISSGKLFDFATKYLRQSELKNAWVNYSTKRTKSLGIEYAGRIKRLDDRSTGFISDKNDVNGRNCWLLWNMGILEEVPCLGYHAYGSICQLGHY